MYQHFKNILDTALENDDFFKVALPTFDSNVLDNKELDEDIIIFTGATRATIIDSNYDWVCKFDCEQDARGSACEREYRRYQLAKEFGVQDMLTPVVYLGTYIKDYMGYDVDPWDYSSSELDQYKTCEYHVELELYAYKKANTDVHIYGSFNSLSAREKHDLDYAHSPLTQRSTDVGAAFMREYGSEKYNMLDHFCREYKVNDLHRNNVGLIGNKLVIIDYAGYYDREYYTSEEEEYDTSSETNYNSY